MFESKVLIDGVAFNCCEIKNQKLFKFERPPINSIIRELRCYFLIFKFTAIESLTRAVFHFYFCC